MTPHGWYRADIMAHGFAEGDQLGLRWDRILRAVEGTPLTLTAPIDADSAPANDAGGAVPNLTTPADAADPAGGAAPGLFSHPPYFADEPLYDSGSYAPGDPAPPAGFILKSEALIWSGPAIMAFPGDAHDIAGGAANPDSNPAGTADPSAIADVAETPGALTRADFDPVLAAMGSSADHAAPAGPGGADLSNAFLPPDGDLAHQAHGLDPGFAFTPPPMPPPPDIIG